MTDYRLIAVDVDGTLLNTEGKISERTRGALKSALAHGATLAVATGRRRRTAQPILDQLGLPHFLVASQGAAIWQDGALLAHSHLPAESARIALEIIRRHEMVTVILGNSLVDEVLWVDGDWRANERIATYVSRNLHLVQPFRPEALDHDPIQFITMDTMERLERLDEALTGHQAPPPSEDPPAQEGPTHQAPLWRVIFSRNQF
ncbi:MAG: HAD family hydrolase, partial [Chloroflexota bacterium]